MKKIAIVAAFLSLGLTTLAQESLTIKMVNKIKGLPPEYEAMGEMEILTYMKGEKTKTEVSSMMVTSTSVNDGEKITSITEQMGNKTGFTMSKAEMDEAEKKEKEKPNKPKIEYTTEKKTIAGYECTKVIITNIDKDKKENKTVAWVTEKIKRPASPRGRGGMMGPDVGDLKGFPMEMNFKQNQQGMELDITMTVTEVKTDNLADSVFKIDTEGYKISTYKEMQEQMKAMQGGK
jgi:hypothetical protein